MNYNQFLESKQHSSSDSGFEPTYVPDRAFDFQRHIIEKAVRKGRMAVFADTGLGKTLIQLSLAQNIVEKTNKKVLILTPLAVAFQFLDEAAILGICDIEHTRDGKHTKKIVVCNYERLHLLNASDFEGVILDESSILKNFEGKIKKSVTAFVKKVRYRYLSTATPSPNDFIELGTSSEALGHMGYADVLTTFFKNNRNSTDTRSRNIGEKYYLKPHAEGDFFAWINQWAMMVKKPSDLGFDDSRYSLPKLTLNTVSVPNPHSELSGPAKTFTEIRTEQKQTVSERCERAVHLAEGKTSVYWCNRNDESSLLKQMDPDAVEILGKMSVDKKEEILTAFVRGDITRLITKAKMTSMGLNWQHCNHSVFFPTYSYEQYYQAIRRFWRFGQTSEVVIDLVISEGQTRVIEALSQKTEKAVQLYQGLVKAVNTPYHHQVKEFNQQVTIPEFLK